MTTRTKVFWVLVAVIILCGVIYALPPVGGSMSFDYGKVSNSLHDTFFPPDQTEIAAKVLTPGTPSVGGPSSTPGTVLPATLTPTGGFATPQITLTPLPGSVALKGISHIDQRNLWNYSPPASLAMQLSFWGWTGKFEDIDQNVKPFKEDYNVMPYELADFVTGQTNFSVITREGGTLDVLKRLVAGGYAVLIEEGINVKDTATGKSSWMNHYNVVSGYSDATQEIIVQDPAYPPDLHIKYDTILQDWRPFDYIFLVVYPPDKEKDLMSVLGDYADEGNSYRIAYNKATQEINSSSGVDTVFAWFNRGASQVNLQDYTGAADSYDEAFAAYAKLAADQQPFRLMWYQTGPYFAYYYMFRYKDIIDLANQTIASTNKPYLEESYYWRGRAERANEDTNSDIADQRLALIYHPGFKPSLEELKQLGINN
jgi:hypothetical protein